MNHYSVGEAIFWPILPASAGNSETLILQTTIVKTEGGFTEAGQMTQTIYTKDWPPILVNLDENDGLLYRCPEDIPCIRQTN